MFFSHFFFFLLKPVGRTAYFNKRCQRHFSLKQVFSTSFDAEWVSSITYPTKPDGSVRICLDPHNLNKAIIREHYKAPIFPILEEISHQLAGSTVFSKLDQKNGFWNIHLDTLHHISQLSTPTKAGTNLKKCPLALRCHKMFSR